jgi:cell division protein FtsW (lipid II flippase)
VTTTLAPPVAPATSPMLRLELFALILATFVVVCGVALTAVPSVVASAKADRTPEDLQSHVALSLALVLAGFYGLHALRRARRYGGDGLLLPAVLLLCGLGLMTMISVSDPHQDAMFVRPFAWGVFIGCVAAGIAMTVNYERLRSFTYLPLAAALALSAVLIVFGSGPGSSGVKVNLWGGQPVEAIRLLEVLFIAGYLGSRWEYLRTLRDPQLGRTRLLAGVHIPPLDYLLPLLLCLAASLSFYVVQKDLGPALVMACLFLALYSVACGRVGLATGGLAALIAAFAVGYHFGIPSTVRTRAAIWLSPWENGLRGGDQVAQGIWSLASGGAVGAGAGLGDAQLVPAAHTDFVLAVLGEDLGFVGVIAALALYALVIWRASSIALRAEGDYSRFLALGLALGLVLQVLLIAGGILALVPLSGVVTPFVSYGKSAMIVNLAGLGILLSIANRASRVPADAFRVPIRRLAFLLAALGLVIVGRAAQVQVATADEAMAKSVLTLLADGTYRFNDNPRLTAAARDLIPRGRIVDRNGLPLAFSGRDPIAPYRSRFAQLGIDVERVCAPADTRCYPLGGRAYHFLGDIRTERDWSASNTSFIERDAAPHLRGFDDRASVVTVPRPDGKGSLRLVRRDYSDLVPLARNRHRPDRPEVQRVLQRGRDLRMTIDGRLQLGLATLLQERFTADGHQRGAAIVLDVATHDVLAAVSYPWPDLQAAAGAAVAEDEGLDRVRYGLYPPGSAFKLVTSITALRRRAALADRPYQCERLPNGRVGRQIPDWTRPIRDDALDESPHGAVTLNRGLVVSCNAYFAQLAVHLGPEALAATAHEFDMAVGSADPRVARANLPFTAIGQADVLTTPSSLAQVVATIASRGVLARHRWVLDPEPSKAPVRRVMSRAAADQLARAMRDVVTSGTGRVLRTNATAIAGKTGTAEVEGRVSHSWFAGFAPYQRPGRQIAFVVLVENGGYGARAAAPLAGALVDLARQLEIIH